MIKYISGALCLLGSVGALISLAFSELTFQDTQFAIYFGFLTLIASVSFFIILRNEDNEETNPEKEKAKR